MSINKTLSLQADTQKLPLLLDTLDDVLSAVSCPEEARTQLAVAAEEIFVNIANYAYQASPEPGSATIRIQASSHEATITFADSGFPYNPLEKQDPDIDKEAEDRPIGGLGVFLVKQMTDKVTYEYSDGLNILTFTKKY